MNTRTIDPTRDDIKRLVTSVPAETPIIMLNLLRFRSQAAYPAESGHTPCPGREAYQRYARVALPTIKQLGGKPLFMASALVRVVGPEDEDWDEVLLVHYPSLGAFLGMLKIPEYQAATVHRTAALKDARLTAMRALDGAD